MRNVWTVIGSSALVVVGTTLMASAVGQETSRSPERTESGLYLLRVVETGYDVTVKETERAATFSVLEMNGLVPTMTAGGVVLFRAVHDVAKERKFEFTFIPPPGPGQPGGTTSRGREGRRISTVTKVFMTNDAETPLKDLLGADYTPEAQQWFNSTGYRSVAQLAVLFGGRGK